tara:strand:- start:882 stop:3119 length:2238 start_codon:yes stop_codon:yes gene_type:complete
MTKKYNPDYLGYNGFIWWFGVVEDNNDPLKTGRVKVRCLEWHTENKGDLPTDELPWAQVMMPVNSASNSGIGESPTGIQNGSWVVGFFMDGETANRPIVMGTIPGIPMEAPRSDSGFNDPNEVYPSLIEQPDTNRLARNDEAEKYKHPNVQTKDDAKKTGVTIANKGTTWDEPASAYAAEYPKNDVYEGSGGVIREYDNTPGNERIHHYHPAGSFSEYNAEGNHHQRIVGDNYQIILGKNSIYIQGDANLTVDGNCHTYIKGNWDVYVGGYKKEVIGENFTQEVGKEIEVTSGQDTIINAGGNMDLKGSRIDLNKEVGGVFGDMVGQLASFSAGGLLSNLGGAMMESIGNIGEVLTSSLDLGGLTDAIGVDAISELGDGTGLLGGTASFMSGAGSSLTSSGLGGALSGALGAGGSVGGFDIGGGLTSAFKAATSGSIPGLSSLSSLSTLGRGLDIVNTVKNGIDPVISFAGGNLNPSNFLGNIGSDFASKFTGDLSKTFEGAADFAKQLTTNFNIQNVLGSNGAEILGNAVSNVFDPANALNGFTQDIFAGKTLSGVTQALLGDSNLISASLLNKQFDVNVQELFNAQSLLKSVVDPSFANLELTDKISSALELDNIVQATLGSQSEFLESFSSSQLLSVEGLKQEVLFNLENRVFDSIRSVDTPNLIRGVTDSANNLDVLKVATERVSPINTADGLFATRNGQTVEVFRTGLETSDGTPITAANIRTGIADYLEIARAANKNGA